MPFKCTSSPTSGDASWWWIHLQLGCSLRGSILGIHVTSELSFATQIPSQAYVD